MTYMVGSAAINSRHAAVNTRHRTRPGRPRATADDGDQDADTAPEPRQAEPTTPSTAALRSVGDHRWRLLPNEGRPTPEGEPQANLGINARGGDFYLATSGYFYLAIDRVVQRRLCQAG